VKKAKKHIPNLLSLLRIAITPCVILLLQQRTLSAWWFALVLFTIAVITDFYDGYFARKHSLISRTGNFLDPLADKILVLSMFGAFCLFGVCPVWLFVVILIRELSVTLLRYVVESGGRQFRTSSLGKWKTVIQFIAIYVFFLSFGGLYSSDILNQIMIYLVVGSSIFSALHYGYCNRSFLKGLSNAK